MVAMRDPSGAAHAVGRFTGWEPLGFEAGDNNWYRFVANRPTGKTDPSGLREPGFWSLYFHYLTHPWAMDNDLEYAFYGSAGVAVVTGGAAVAGVATGVGTVGSVGAGVSQVTVVAGTIAAHPNTPSLINGIAEAAAGIDGPGLDVGDVARAGTRAAGRCPAARGIARLPTKSGQLGHIFRNALGHLADTPANRQLLTDVASNPANRVGVDKFGNVWSSVTRTDGAQVWVSTRNGVIQNGGLNQVPQAFPTIVGP